MIIKDKKYRIISLIFFAITVVVLMRFFPDASIWLWILVGVIEELIIQVIYNVFLKKRDDK